MRSATRPWSNRTDRLRHDRGSAHIDPGRTSLAHPNCRCTDSRANSCHSGAGANATAHAIELTRDAEAAGADAVLSVVPYYNKPMQAGLYAHFRSIAESTGLPIILYDVPSEQPVVFQIIRLRGWRSCRASLGLRMRRATRRGRHACDRWSARISGCCAERMLWLCRISHRAAMGAFQ